MVAYHTSRGVPVARARRPLRPHPRPRRALRRRRTSSREQRAWYDGFWAAQRRRGLDGSTHDAIQQAIRYNLFTLAQASRPRRRRAWPPRGSAGSGYEGHYFWDTEVYVVPFLTYTAPRRRPEPPALPQPDAAARPGPRAASWPARAPCSRGARSTARRPRRTTPPAPPSCTSTPTSSTPCVQYVDATGDVGVPACARRPTSSSRPRGCGPTSGSGAQRRALRSTSTGSPGPTSTRPSSTTTCSPT